MSDKLLLFVSLLAILLDQSKSKMRHSIRITGSNLNSVLLNHKNLVIFIYSSNHGPSVALKEELEQNLRRAAFEHSKLEMAELDTTSYTETLPSFANTKTIPGVSFYYNGKHHLLTKEKLEVN